MKAILVSEFGGSEKMIYTEVERPSITEQQVLIKVAAASVNFADIKSRYGKKGGKLPFIPGIDAAGVIEEVGEEVEGLYVGQRVIAFPKGGSYAEYAVAEDVLTYPIPDGMSFEDAAACPIVSFLSHKLLIDIARIEKAETVLIHAAAGGVGTTAIQLAKHFGAGMVIGTVGSAKKMNAAFQAGADHVILYDQEDFAAKVNELTDGAGVDIILDSIAGDVTENSLRCLADYGRLVHFGNSSGKVGTIHTKDLHQSCRSVLGFSLGTTRSKRPEMLRETAEHVLPLIAAGHLKMNIGKTFKLQEAAKAHEWVESRQSIGKVLLIVE